MPETAKLTRNQQLVIQALEQAAAPMTAYEILDALRKDGFRAPPQVYRALEKLQSLGLAHRLESLNAFVVCRHVGSGAHRHDHAMAAFAICDECGQVAEFEVPDIEAALGVWSKDKGFFAQRTTLELRGRCENCRTT